MNRARQCATAFGRRGQRWCVVVVGAAGGAGVSGASYLRGRPQSSVSLGAPLPTLDRVAPPWRSRQRHAKGSMCSHMEGRRSGRLWGLYGRQHGAGGWVAAEIRPRNSRVRAGALYEYPRPCMHALIVPQRGDRTLVRRSIVGAFARAMYTATARAAAAAPAPRALSLIFFAALVACAGAPNSGRYRIR